MQNAIRYVIANLLLAASAFAGVTISSPAPGSTSGSPVHFVASASASLPISAMRIYVDDTNMYTTHASSLDTTVTMATGSHNVVIVAWDTNGTAYTQGETITVGSAPAPSSGVTVSSPADGSSVGSPIHVVASANASAPIAAMRIYMDDTSVFTVNANQIDTQVNASTGSHHLVIVAWDNNGNPYNKSLTVSVNSAPPPPSASGVTISSPTIGASTPSPIHVVASASAGQPIAAMRIYLDSNNMYTVNSNQIDTSVTASMGSHDLVIVAWDTNGNPYRQELTVNVTGSSGPPAGATTVNEIQQIGGWGSCTVCAGAGGNGPAAQYSTQQGVGSPSLSGSSMQFNISGSTPWSDVLWWKDLTPNDNATNFRYDLDFYITQPQFAQALEFDVNFIDGSTGTYYIFGTQCDIIGVNQFDVWDTAGNTWVHTGIPCSAPSAFTWHHLTWEFYRDSNQAHFVAVTLDGVKHFVNMAFFAKPGGNSGVGIAFQMDGDSSMHSYSVWLDNVTLSYW